MLNSFNSKSIDVFINTDSHSHCVKSVRIRIFAGPYFPVFGLNTETYGVSLPIQSECGKIRTRKTPNTDTFNVVSQATDYYILQNLDRNVVVAL